MILMHSALYGRMRVGRCLPMDLGYMGCQADALEPLDKECTGKAECTVLLIDKRLTSLNGCLKRRFELLASGAYLCQRYV